MYRPSSFFKPGVIFGNAFAITACVVCLASFYQAPTHLAINGGRTNDISSLVIRLRASLVELETRHSRRLLLKHTIIGQGFSSAIGALLLRSNLAKPSNITLGVTGGSSSSGNFAPPNGLTDQLSHQIQHSFEVRNAAMGATSQLVTSPCIQTLVGEAVDVLFWEFGMNDEPVIRQLPPDEFYLRHRVAEAYIRQAIAINPPAMGYVHFWDMRIHSWQGNASDLPDRSFHPTSNVMRYYSGIYDRYFAVNVIGFMADAKLYNNKTDFLRDPHHPNELGYAIAVDLLAYCIVKGALEFFVRGSQPTLELEFVRSSPEYSPVWTYPMMSYSNQRTQHVMPGQTLFGHCLMSHQPTFAQNNTIQIIEHSGKIRNVGKSDPRRADRKLSFVIGPCSNGSNFVVSIDVPHAAYIVLSCQCFWWWTDCKHIEARLEQVGVIKPNVDVGGDVMEVFYSWVHKINASNITGTRGAREVGGNVSPSVLNLLFLEQDVDR